MFEITGSSEHDQPAKTTSVSQNDRNIFQKSLCTSGPGINIADAANRLDPLLAIRKRTQLFPQIAYMHVEAAVITAQFASERLLATGFALDTTLPASRSSTSSTLNSVLVMDMGSPHITVREPVCITRSSMRSDQAARSIQGSVCASALLKIARIRATITRGLDGLAR